MVDDNLLETDRKRYADDITLQELVRLRVENEQLRWALKRISICEGGDVTVIWKEMRDIAIEALQQKDSE